MAAEVRITTASKDQRKEYSIKHAEALAKIFRTDPGIRFVTSALSRKEHDAYLQPYMGALMKASLLNDAVFQEANDWSTVAVWMPPGARVDNPWTILQAGLIPITLKLGFGGVKVVLLRVHEDNFADHASQKMLVDFQSKMDALKKKHLTQHGIKRYWYFFFIGTLEHARGEGLGGEVIREWQKKMVAEDEKLPIWLEATTENSKRLYERCGFKLLEEVVVGEGTHDADGEEKRGGEGVRLWAMLWKPEYASATAA